MERIIGEIMTFLGIQNVTLGAIVAALMLALCLAFVSVVIVHGITAADVIKRTMKSTQFRIISRFHPPGCGERGVGSRCQ